MSTPTLAAVPDDAPAPRDLAVELDNLASVARPKIGRRKTKTLTDARRLLRRNLPRIPRTREGMSGSGDVYRYADLDTVERVVWPYLDAYGLDWTTLPTMNAAGKFVLAYRLEHIETGQALTGEYPIRESHPQDQGGALTYAQRYTLQAVTGAIVEGEDNDCARTPKAAPAKPAETSARNAGRPGSAGARVTQQRIDEWTRNILATRTPAAANERWRDLRKQRMESEVCQVDADTRAAYDLPPQGSVTLEDLAQAVIMHLTDVPDLPPDPDDEPAGQPARTAPATRTSEPDAFDQIAAVLPGHPEQVTPPTD